MLTVTGVAELADDAGSQQPSTESVGGSERELVTVTLITGDTVTVVQTPAGRSVVPKAAPGRESVVFGTRRIGDSINVYPSDVVGLVASGRLGQRLFNVTGLVDAGLDDKRSATLPLIVQFQPAMTLGSLRGALVGPRMPVANSAAVLEQKASAAAFWGWLTNGSKPTPRRATVFNSTVAQVWLDGKVRAHLDKSVPQVQAPGACGAGYTGKGVGSGRGVPRRLGGDDRDRGMARTAKADPNCV